MTLEIGRALKRLRIERKLTQKELAAIVSGGLDYTYIGKIEREEQLPSLKILIKIAQALAVPLSLFFVEEDGFSSLYGSKKIVDLAATREMSHLLKELKRLHPRDIPLLIDIVRALNAHRNLKTENYGFPENDLALVAEPSPDYDDKDDSA